MRTRPTTALTAFMLGGTLVELPGTIATIRATMPPPQAEAFDRETEHVPAADLHTALVRWALAGTTADKEDDDLFERLIRGEDIGAVPADTDRPEVA